MQKSDNDSERGSWATARQLSGMVTGHGRQGTPRGALAKPVLCSLSRWEALLRYIEDGRLLPGTNAAENAIRSIAVGPR